MVPAQLTNDRGSRQFIQVILDTILKCVQSYTSIIPQKREDTPEILYAKIPQFHCKVSVHENFHSHLVL
jgi:hypothetical protein